MPSPIGHALGGAAAGWLAAAHPESRSPHAWWKTGLAFAALGMLPDLDLLVGQHRGPSHALAAAVIVGLLAAVLTRRRQLSVAAAAAYASHALLDWLGSDSSPPIGIMALWPISREYFESNLHLFQAISRRYWMPGFLAHNVRAVAWELVVLTPLAAAGFVRQRRAFARTRGQ